MGTRNVTSSLVLGAGPMQLDWLDGLSPGQCGPDHRHANHSAQQVNIKGPPTSDTFGPSGSTLSKSADLQSFLENKLAQRLSTAGSTNCRKTWKRVITPAGRSLSRLVVSELFTSGNESSLWPTATTRDHKGGYSGGRIRNGKWSTDTLDVAAQLTGWLTPTTSDMHGVRELDGKRSGGLNTQATTVFDLWTTPTRDDTTQRKKKYAQGGSSLSHQSSQVSGMESKPSSAKTEKSERSQLNPRFSLWLMGYPIEWACCAERVTRSSRKSRQKS